jgi:signal transduction histidine kinase
MSNRELEIAILCPIGQDANLIAQALLYKSIHSNVVLSIEQFSRLNFNTLGGFIVAEEALTQESIDELNRIIGAQEAWSDIPIILLISGGNKQFKLNRLESFVSAGNVTLLERPLQPLTLISATSVAMRSRRRQYQVQELIKSQLAATKMRDEFISIASHELKTPLTSLKLQTQLAIKQSIKEEELSTEKVQKQLIHTIKQVDRLNKLVDDMLNISRINVGKLQLDKTQLDLSELTNELVERFRPQFTAVDCKVETNIKKGIIGLWDSFKIEQVINNIFSNAIRYSPASIIKVKLFKESNKAVLTVEDEGPGIEEENLERIFERFERLSSSIGGLGLGLYITRQILELHNGTSPAAMSGYFAPAPTQEGIHLSIA